MRGLSRSEARGACAEDGGGTPLVLRAQPVPAVQLDALRGELDRALAREPGQDGLHRLLLGDARLERLLAAEPGGDLQRLAAVVSPRGRIAASELHLARLCSDPPPP